MSEHQTMIPSEPWQSYTYAASDKRPCLVCGKQSAIEVSALVVIGGVNRAVLECYCAPCFEAWPPRMADVTNAARIAALKGVFMDRMRDEAQKMELDIVGDAESFRVIV